MPAFSSISSRDKSPGYAAINLSQQMAKYQQLRLEEKKLRERVEYLEKQVALKGPMAVEVDLAMLLKKESAELLFLRESLHSQEQELASLENLSKENQSIIQKEQLEQLIADLRAKKEQISILQHNINFLEEKQAQYGIDIPVNLANELKLAKESLSKVQEQLGILKKQLLEEWHYDPAESKNFDSLDKDGLLKLAAQLIKKHEQEIEKQHQKAGDQYNPMIMEILEELRNAVFHGSNSKVIRKNALEWEINIAASFGGVLVILKFNHKEEARSLEYIHKHHDGHTLNRGFAELSRKSLIETFKSSFWRKKEWWQFWVSAPKLPESWK